MIVDTHCHLDSEKFEEDLEDVLKRAKDENIESIIIPGADPKDLPKAVKISQKESNIYFAAGVHPYDAKNYDKSFLLEYLDHPKCVAVGECGLDYHRLPKDEKERSEEKELQKEVFIGQIELAKEFKKPLIIHIREATHDSKEIILGHSADSVGGVLHCYNASPELLTLANYGFYFGIGGVLTFKNAKKLVENYVKIPHEKLLIETDAPYLTPEPNRGKRNEPCYTKYVAEKMASLSGLTYDDICSITTKNAKKLFAI